MVRHGVYGFGGLHESQWPTVESIRDVVEAHYARVKCGFRVAPVYRTPPNGIPRKLNEIPRNEFLALYGKYGRPPRDLLF